MSFTPWLPEVGPSEGDAEQRLRPQGNAVCHVPNSPVAHAGSSSKLRHARPRPPSRFLGCHIQTSRHHGRPSYPRQPRSPRLPPSSLTEPTEEKRTLPRSSIGADSTALPPAQDAAPPHRTAVRRGASHRHPPPLHPFGRSGRDPRTRGPSAAPHCPLLSPAASGGPRSGAAFSAFSRAYELVWERKARARKGAVLRATGNG